MVITGVANRIPERIFALIYLDGQIPENSQASVELLGNPQESKGFSRRVTAGSMPHQHHSAVLEELQIPRDDAWKYTLHPIGAWVEPIELTDACNDVSKRIFVWVERSPRHRQFYERVRHDRPREDDGRRVGPRDFVRCTCRVPENSRSRDLSVERIEGQPDPPERLGLGDGSALGSCGFSGNVQSQLPSLNHL